MNGIGIDIEKISRFKNISYFDRFLNFVFSENEINQIRDASEKFQYVASRFALKEAVIKAYPNKITYRDIEIFKNGDKPEVKISGESRKILVSLSHDQESVVGVAFVD
jgi:holo-[acyl-carrier protein] synthase